MKTKSQPPLESRDPQDMHPLVAAYYELNQLKLLYRQGWLKRGISPVLCESVAEHTLGVAVLAMWIADLHFQHLDRQKVLRMALLHDFGEIYAGDITPADPVESTEKNRQEAQAVRKVFSRLVNGADYLGCWEEFERGETPEARFVRQIDRLEMALQASIYVEQGLESREEFFATARGAISDAVLLEIFQTVEKS